MYIYTVNPAAGQYMELVTPASDMHIIDLIGGLRIGPIKEGWSDSPEPNTQINRDTPRTIQSFEEINDVAVAAISIKYQVMTVMLCSLFIRYSGQWQWADFSNCFLQDHTVTQQESHDT